METLNSLSTRKLSTAVTLSSVSMKKLLSLGGLVLSSKRNRLSKKLVNGHLLLRNDTALVINTSNKLQYCKNTVLQFLRKPKKDLHGSTTATSPVSPSFFNSKKDDSG